MLTDINELWIRYLLLSEQFHYIQHFILFQYISCYSLSVQGAAEMPWLISFNTSHVTLYLRQASYIQSSVLVSIHLMLLFIEFMRDNYLTPSCFNTSHVTLYPNSVRSIDYKDIVSIHLMLLFISEHLLHILAP